MAEPFCPLYTLRAGRRLEDCLEARCAWWFEDRKTCSIKQLVQALYDIRWELMGVEDRLARSKGG